MHVYFPPPPPPPPHTHTHIHTHLYVHVHVQLQVLWRTYLWMSIMMDSGYGGIGTVWLTMRASAITCRYCRPTCFCHVGLFMNVCKFSETIPGLYINWCLIGLPTNPPNSSVGWVSVMSLHEITNWPLCYLCFRLQFHYYRVAIILEHWCYSHS